MPVPGVTRAGVLKALLLGIHMQLLRRDWGNCKRSFLKKCTAVYTGMLFMLIMAVPARLGGAGAAFRGAG
jgi:hypothetical protein